MIKKSFPTILPVVLCGGSGTRLWPLSNPNVPKQFISLSESSTLLGETLKRIDSITDICKTENFPVYESLLIMNESHKLPIELSNYNSRIVYEKYANDTSVAVANAVLRITLDYPGEDIIMLMLPADHYIDNTSNFVNDVVMGLKSVTSDNIVLYGIDPIGPETKYGYIIPGPQVTFHEKPNSDKAKELIGKGGLWNSGMFAAKIETLYNALEKSSHNIIDWTINPRPGKLPSFDVTILQEYKYIHAYHCKNWGWSDVGTWESFLKIKEIEKELEGEAGIIKRDCNNIDVLNRGTGRIVIIGCENLNIIVNGNDILILHKEGDHNDHVKAAATMLTT